MIYANNAGTTWPKPREVHVAVSAALSAAPAEHDRIRVAAQHEVARFLDLPDPDRFRFTPSCTSALRVAIGDLPWREGDEIVTSAIEHHALARPVADLVRDRGVRHVVAPYRPGSPIDLDFVRRRLEQGAVRLVATSSASNVTGEVLPARALADLAHAYGALYLLDAAQTVGVLPQRIRELGADLVAFAGHKGPLGPQGIGGFWASADVTFESPRAACEVGALGPASDCDPFPSYCDLGSINVAGAAGLAAGMRWLHERDAAVVDRPRRLAAQLAASVGAGCHVYGGRTAERTGVVSVRIDALPVERAEAYFARHGVAVRAGQHCAPSALEAIGAPQGTIRISFGHFNTEADVEQIATTITDID